MAGVARDGSERLRRVVEELDLGPDDRVVEIGCGHGVAATLICERLDGGTYVGIDRSQKMIAMAAKRNDACVAAGTAAFQVAELEHLDLGDRRFDKLLAVRVGLFWKRPDEAYSIARGLLAPGGMLHVH